MRRAAAGLALWLALGCGGAEPGDIEPDEEPVEVQVSSPVRRPSLVAHPATVVSSDEAAVATRVSGRVRRIEADVGRAVAEGEALVFLDATDVRAQVEGAQAGLRRARRRYRRIAALARDGAATQQELDDARAAFEQARSEVRAAAAQRDYVVLRAPFDGVVSARHADPGDLATPGRPILTVVRGASLEIEAAVPEGDAAAFREGDAATVFHPASGRRYPVTVVRTSPSVDPASRRKHVEARLDPAGAVPDLLPGTFVRLEAEAPDRTTLWLPEDTIVRRGQLRGVFEVADETLQLRWVRLGQAHEGAVELLGGIGPDARVVRAPGAGLSDGQPVASARAAPPLARQEG